MKGHFKTIGQTITLLFAAAALSFAQYQGTSSAPYQGPSSPQKQMPVQQQSESMPPPGALNYVEGQVSLDGEQLTPQSVKSTIIQPGQAIDTQKGYAEILLSPGAFLRVGNNSEVRLVAAGLADTKLDVVRGSAMIEAAELVKGAALQVSMNGVTADVQKNGLYDFNAQAQSIRVLDGKLKVIGTSGESTLSKGDQILLASDKPLKKRDFDKKIAQADPLYVWSKVRSDTEAQANVNIASNIEAYGGWNGAGWYWDPFWSSYAFLPGAGFIGSPFGWGFYSPAYVYASPYYYGRFGYERYGYGHYGYGGRAWAGNRPGYYPGHGFRGSGFNGAHATGGVHAAGGGGGGFHGGGGGGFHGGGGGGGHR